MSFLDTIFNPVLGPFLNMPPALGILLISFIITVVITVIYKFTTKQKEMHKIKKEMKDYQKQLKTLAKTDPKKAMAVQKKAMESNFAYMKHSLRSTLITFIPLILIFGWLNSHMAYEPVRPGESFTVTAAFDKYYVGNATLTTTPDLTFVDAAQQEVKNGVAVWTLSGGAGAYSLIIRDPSHEYSKSVLITPEKKYDPPIQYYKGTAVQKITVGNKRVWPFGSWFNIFGWHPGWLGTYIISSVAFSMLLRKILNLA
jgi:uncharacterized membrane protein (DUF106 family)